MKKNCKNCIFRTDCRIPGFVICGIKKEHTVKQESDTCEDCEVEYENVGQTWKAGS